MNLTRKREAKTLSMIQKKEEKRRSGKSKKKRMRRNNREENASQRGNGKGEGFTGGKGQIDHPPLDRRGTLSSAGFAFATKAGKGGCRRGRKGRLC